MKYYRLLPILVFCSFSLNILAQNNTLFVPLDIQKAYNKQTRSFDGKPGKNYWQNFSKYIITADFDPSSGVIKGEEKVTYFNNSPEALNYLLFKLYQNLYQKGSIRDRYIDPVDITEGVKIEGININGKAVPPYLLKSYKSNHGTNLILNNSVGPKDSVIIQFRWSFTMPQKTKIRMGTYGKNTSMIAYWYPQIAVNNDISGWDMIEYNGLQEFNQEYADYDVKITIPGNQIVWASGELLNPKEVLAQQYYSLYNSALTSDGIVHIISKEDILNKNQITLNPDKNTWHFITRNVLDFCFATSDHYLWDACNLVIDKKNNKQILVSAAYKPSAKDYENAAEICRKTIKYLSFEMPGIPYPYPRLTTFDGSGGMEFPMFVNVGSTYGESETMYTLSHEIAHIYFPFYMGINQVKYSWMDEGWAMFLPYKLQLELANNFSPSNYGVDTYNSLAGTELEAPMMQPSIHLRGYEYYVSSYYRSSAAYHVLENILGKDLFLKTLQEYIRRWNGKHPLPYDFFFTFNDIAKEDLGWFWKPWFFEPGYPDLSVQNVKIKNNICNITIKNTGTMPVPIVLELTFEDNTILKHEESAKVWKNGQKKIDITKNINKKLTKVTLGNDEIPDVNKEDNQFLVSHK